MGTSFPDKCKSWTKNAAASFMENGFFYVAGFFAVLGVKYYYSSADAGTLGWILTPAARLVAMLSGINFEWERHAGYVNHSHGVVIAPACAGVNFLIISFATIFFTFVSRLKGSGAKCAWLCFSVIAAYLVTLFANTLRIIISIFLYDLPVYGGWITPGRVHQLAGTLIFVSVLVATYLIVERMIRRFTLPAPRVSPAGSRRVAGIPLAAAIFLAPFGWYALITVIVPFLNGSARRFGSGFAEHSVMVMIACGCVFMLSASVMSTAKKNVDRLNKTKEKGGNGKPDTVCAAANPGKGAESRYENAHNDRR